MEESRSSIMDTYVAIRCGGKGGREGRREEELGFKIERRVHQMSRKYFLNSYPCFTIIFAFFISLSLCSQFMLFFGGRGGGVVVPRVA